ncbi:MAG: Fur family transcriptional regulator [Arachnia sp.]
MTSTNTSRNTWQRTAIRDFLAGIEEFRTASQIHEDLKLLGDRIGMATVYRALQAMVEAGEVDMLRTPDGEATYRKCSDGHHHHLVCRRCGVAEEIAAEVVEIWATEVAHRHGFTDVAHEVELYGLCAACSTSFNHPLPS